MSDKKFLTTSEATKLIPSHPSTVAVWRWMRRGVKSRSGRTVRLNHVRFGGKLFTTAEDVTKFAEELAQADAEHFNPAAAFEVPPARRSESRREAELSVTKKRLKDAGIA